MKKLNLTKGTVIGNCIRPFIGMESTGIDETVKAIGKMVDSAFAIELKIVYKTKQLLSCLDYGKLTDYQREIIDSIELEIKYITK